MNLSYFLKRLIFGVLIWNRFVESPSEGLLIALDLTKMLEGAVLNVYVKDNAQLFSVTI